LSYQEAVAGEVGISRLIESRGYRISRVRNQSFEIIGHRQWTGVSRALLIMKLRLRRSASDLLGRLGLKKLVKQFLATVRRRAFSHRHDSTPQQGGLINHEDLGVQGSG
jgi:hypothetical protein